MGKNRDRKLRLAMFVNDAFTIPPKGVIMANYTVTLQIADGMAERGHDVSLFGAKGSKAKATIVDMDLPPLSQTDVNDLIQQEPPDVLRRGIEPERTNAFWNNYMLSEIYRIDQERPFDVIHQHQFHRSAPYARLTKTPNIFTMHYPITPLYQFLFKHYNETPNIHNVSISKRQQETAPELKWYRNIYHGVDLDQFKFSADSDGYFMFAGRIELNKGTHRSAQAASEAGVPLKIYGPHSGHGTDNEEYWNKEVAPLLSNSVTYEGFKEMEEMHAVYGKAKGILMPISWEEPFGMVAIEAMACGTPVIAFRHGALPEIVVDGKTGFVVDTVEEMVAAIKKIDTIDRAECRRHVEAKFPLARMLDDYENAYYDLASRR